MARVLVSRQFADWRKLRFEAFTSQQVREAIAQLASRIRDTFWQPSVAPLGTVGRGQVSGSAAGSAEQAGGTGWVTARTEPPSHVVDVFPGRGDFATMSAAIQAAEPGDRILVRPGLYEEGLVVDKPLEILGDGPVSDIEIRARGAHVLVFQASIGRVANLTLRQAGGEGAWFGVDIGQGGLDLEGCDISSQSSACVAIRDGADPRLRRNKIHNGKQGGVFVHNGGLGTLEDNDITSNAVAGVAIARGADPTLRRNQIHDNQNGVLIHFNGLGTLEDNDITGAFSGVQIGTGSNPTLRGNRIRDNKRSGVLVFDGGLGTLEDNDITGNAFSGVQITKGSNTILRANRINRNEYKAVSIDDSSLGVIEDNDLTGNARGAWNIAEDCIKNLTRARNKE